MNVMNFSGALGETIQKVSKPFEKDHNVHINWGYGTGTENAAKVAAAKTNQTYDVSFNDMQSQNLASTKGLWSKLDPKVVNVGDIFEATRAPNNDGVPIGTIEDMITYDTKVFEAKGWSPPTAMSDILDPKFCNQVGILDVGASYGLYVVLGLGGLTAQQATAGDLEKPFDLGLNRLKEHKSCFPSIESSAGALGQKITSGQYTIAITGSVRALPIIMSGAPVKAVVPKEGAFLTISYASPVKGAPNPKLAQELVAFFATSSVQQKLMEETFYGPTNKNVKVPEELQKLGVLGGKSVSKFIVPAVSKVAESRTAWTDKYQRAVG